MNYRPVFGICEVDIHEVSSDGLVNVDFRVTLHNHHVVSALQVNGDNVLMNLIYPIQPASCN